MRRRSSQLQADVRHNFPSRQGDPLLRVAGRFPDGLNLRMLRDREFNQAIRVTPGDLRRDRFHLKLAFIGAIDERRNARQSRVSTASAPSRLGVPPTDDRALNRQRNANEPS